MTEGLRLLLVAQSVLEMVAVAALTREPTVQVP